MLTGIFALVFGSFLTWGVLRFLVTAVGDVRVALALRRRGRTATATIVSLAELDPESSTRRAVVRFETGPGREVRGTADIRWKGLPELVAGTQVEVRYDPATPGDLAPEAGRRQGIAEIRVAVVVSALLLVLVLPTSIYLALAGLLALLP